MHSETAYLFRHAVLRDAAYQLQLPTTRARLHGLSFAILEQVFGGRPPESPPIDFSARRSLAAHPADAFAEELADHSRLANGPPESECFWLRRAAEFAENRYRLESAVALWERLARLSGPPRDADLFSRAALCAWKCGQLDRAEPLFRTALAGFRATGERLREGILLNELGALLFASGKVAEAETLLDQALAALRGVAARRHEGRALHNLGRLYTRTGRIERAEAALREALAISRECRNPVMQGNILNSLSGLYDATDRFAEALPCCESALSLHRAARNRRGEGSALGDLASLHHALGRHADAERGYREALAIHREVGNRAFEALTIGNLASLAHDAGRFEEAESLLRRSVALQREARDRRLEGTQLCMHARSLAALRRFDEARAAWLEGGEILQSLGDRLEHQRWAGQLRRAWEEAGGVFPEERSDRVEPGGVR